MTQTPAQRDERELYTKFTHEVVGTHVFEGVTHTVQRRDNSTGKEVSAAWEAWQARATLADAELAGLRALSVTNIMLAVVPGADGMGEEVYAKSVDDVRQAFTKVEDRADKFQAERDELRAELERVKKDSERLEFLIDKQAYVATGLHGSWVHYVREDSWQTESYPEPRDCIDAEIDASRDAEGGVV